MAQKNKKKSKKWIFWALLVVLFVLAGVIAYLTGRIFFKDQGGILEQPQETPEETEVIKVSEGDEVEIVEEAEPAVPEDKVKQYEGEDPNNLAELTGVITFAEKNGETLIIRTNIDQYLSGGACELILMRGEEIIDKYSGRIVPNAANATCEGFDVPVSGLGSGNINIIINLSSGGKTGTIKGETKI